MGDINNLLQKLEIKKNTGDRIFQAICPAHSDKKASLTITKTDENVVFHCHANCQPDEILRSVNLEWRDVLPEKEKSGNGKYVYTLEQLTNRPDTEVIYQYNDKKNLPYILVVRKTGKDFFQYSYQGDGLYKAGLNGQAIVPYRLPELLKAVEKDEFIFIPEGEKDCNNLFNKFKLTATTNSSGSGGWKKCLNKYFKDAKVVLLPDNDEPGEKHVKDIISNISTLAKEIRILKLPGLPKKGDVSDWIEAGGTKEEFLKLVENAEVYITDAKETNFPETESKEILKSNRRAKKKTKLETLIATEEFLKTRYDFRANIVTNKTEIKEKNSKDWKELTDRITSDLYYSLQKLDINYSIESLRLLLISSAFSPSFNPLTTYFDKLPAWDEERNYIKEFTDCFKLKHPEERRVFEYCFKKWFIATLTGVYSREWCNHTIFIITGEQGDGKTTILNKLIPEELKRYLQIGGLDFSSKDAVIDMCSKFLINIDELEGFTKKDTDQLKSIITKKHFDIRLPYGHNSQKLEKCCSFMASTNRNSFLNDPTGSRRFLIFEIENVNYNQNFDIDGMFSQAKHLYFSGYRYFFTKDDIEKINQRNEKFSSDSIEEQLLLQFFSPAPLEIAEQMSDVKKLEHGIKFFTTTEVSMEISRLMDNKIQINDRFVKKLGSYLRKHSFNRVYKNRNYVWCVKLNSSKELDTEHKMEDFNLENSPF